MKNFKFSRRSFLKAGAAASVAGLVAANAARRFGCRTQGCRR